MMANSADQRETDLDVVRRRTGSLTDAWKHRQGIVGGVILILFAFIAVFGSQIAPLDPIAIDLSKPFAEPIWLDPINGAGLMGTDNLGRDVFSRVLVGSRISLLVGSVAVLVGMVLGVTLGLIAGYRGGLAGEFIMRLADTQSAVPFLVILIAVLAFVGGGLLNIILFLGVGSWVGFARLVRGEVLSIRERDYINAARTVGANDLRIMFRHILPNALAPVIVSATLSFGGMILTESALSFLGLGVSSLVPTWGKMVADGRDFVTTAWYPSVFPALAIMLVVLGANLLGDWLRDIFDPKLRGRQD